MHKIAAHDKNHGKSHGDRDYLTRLINVTVKKTCNIAETRQDRTKGTTDDQWEVAYALSIRTKINVIEWPWTHTVSKRMHFRSLPQTRASLSQGQPRDAPYNECTNPNPPTKNLIPVHNLQLEMIKWRFLFRRK